MRGGRPNTVYEDWIGCGREEIFFAILASDIIREECEREKKNFITRHMKTFWEK